MKTIIFVYSSTRNIDLSLNVQFNIMQIFDNEFYLKILRNILWGPLGLCYHSHQFTLSLAPSSPGSCFFWVLVLLGPGSHGFCFFSSEVLKLSEHVLFVFSAFILLLFGLSCNNIPNVIVSHTRTHPVRTEWLYVCRCVSVFDPWISNILNRFVDFVDKFGQSQKAQSLAVEQWRKLLYHQLHVTHPKGRRSFRGAGI